MLLRRLIIQVMESSTPIRRKPRSLLKRKRGDRPYRLLGLSKAIIQVLGNRFIARTTDLYRLIPKTAIKQTDHERQIRAALKRLRESYDPREKKNEGHRRWGYIRSVSWSDPTIQNKIEYTCLVHGLTDRGVKLARDRGLDPDFTSRSFQEFSTNHVDHELRLADLIDSFSRRFQARGFEFIPTRVNLKRNHIHPDLLFYVYDPVKDLRSAPIFLEYEKQKRGHYDDLDRPQITRKLESFARYYDSAECEHDFHFRKFYTLIVLRTERKAEFLLEDLRHRGIELPTILVVSEPALAGGLEEALLRNTSGERRSLLDL